MEQHYGIGDQDALGNPFASYPQTFSSFPRPHSSQGLHEPSWELRSDYEIYLRNDFPSGRRRSQRIRALITGSEVDPLPPSPPTQPSTQLSTQSQCVTREGFESAMQIVRGVIGEGQKLTKELTESYERVHKWRQRWDWSPLSSDAYESPPPYSPRRTTPTPEVNTSPSTQQSLSSSPVPDQISNPPIPGDPAVSAEDLFNRINEFAKGHGFGIIRRNTHSYKGRKIR
ncbi:hypothetical protein B0T10DRAFT_417921, partial [Thelonectria olida]